MSEYEERKLNGYNVSEFLKYATPALIAEKFTGKDIGAVWRNSRIASGEITTHTDWEEYTYDGKWTPSAVASWLATFHDGWQVATGYDGELYVSREKERPLTEGEIEAAKKWCEEHADLESKYTKWRTPPVLQEEWLKEDE